MSFAAECARYGIDVSDPVYGDDPDRVNGPPHCFCGGHSERNRRANCDLQARRAWMMADPVWCAGCRRVFERDETDASPGSSVGSCGSCFPGPVESPGFRRGGLSPARARKVRLSDPSRTLSSYSTAELFYEAYDELSDGAAA